MIDAAAACAACGAASGCSADVTCWCMYVPRTMPVGIDASCLCRSCLERTRVPVMPPLVDNSDKPPHILETLVPPLAD